MERVVGRVEERLRRKGPEVTSQAVGVEVLANLAKLDQVAYMRFASVYKDFQEITDFQSELNVLLGSRQEDASRRQAAFALDRPVGSPSTLRYYMSVAHEAFESC